MTQTPKPDLDALARRFHKAYAALGKSLSAEEGHPCIVCGAKGRELHAIIENVTDKPSAYACSEKARADRAEAVLDAADELAEALESEHHNWTAGPMPSEKDWTTYNDWYDRVAVALAAYRTSRARLPLGESPAPSSAPAHFPTCDLPDEHYGDCYDTLGNRLFLSPAPAVPKPQGGQT